MPEAQPGGKEPVEFDAAEHSLNELVSEAGGLIPRLVRLEIELAKAELARDAKKVAQGSGLFAVAGVLAHMMLILVLITAALGIMALGLPAWLSFLIVTVAVLLVVLVLGFLGLRQFRKRQGLPRTSATLADSMAVFQRGRRTPGE
ncbi:phage holin family protein [Streptomonospora sp. S1-112]|uniref:Phage holin family protein n=1 Tax=Streptomonospora mangrovi TaxID=2883123 RepID=A0A9X3SGY2_9ACTN|nr:phage holin family protein [Streptomonospora mangrovi]MDA0566490.1 phage holin family protein [Streptomonospora mangrovi]